MKQLIEKIVQDILISEQRNRKLKKSPVVDKETELSAVVVTAQRLNPPVVGYNIISPFGEKRGITRRHKGVDFDCPSGTPVYAIQSGVVVASTVQMNKIFRNQEDGWGRYVIIQHTDLNGSTFYSLYAHLSRVYVSDNSKIRSGDTIGLSGGIPGQPGSGNSEGAHLHFEIKTSLNNGEIDPIQFYEDRNQTIFTGLGKPKSSQDPESVLDNAMDNIKSTSAVSNKSIEVTSTTNIDVATSKTGDTKDGYQIYKLPGDEQYIYGIPLPDRNDISYGWWTYIDSSDKWLELKTHLSPKNYKIATSILNKQFPTAIDINRLNVVTTTNKPKPKPDVTDTDQPATDKLQYYDKDMEYNPEFILTKLKNIPLNIYKNNKFSKAVQPNTNKQLMYTADDGERIRYKGKSSTKKYVYLEFLDSANKSMGKYWVEEKYIK